MFSIIRVAPLAAVLILAPTAVGAQSAAPDDSGITAELLPRIGFVASHYEVGRTAALDDGSYLTLERIGSELTYGAELRVGRADSHWRLRAVALHASKSGMTGSWQCEGLCPLILRAATPARATITTATIGVTYLATVEPAARLRPFGSLGIGIKRHGFEWAGHESSSFMDGSDAHLNPAVSLGVGAEWAWQPMTFMLEAENHASRFDSPDGGVVHDLLLTLGVRIKLF